MNLVCRIYERDKLKNGDIIDDFSKAIGLGLDTDRVRVSSNESLTFETMSALLLINASKHKDNKEFRRRVIAMGNKRKGKRIPMLTKAEAQRFFDQFDGANRQFFETYIDPSLADRFSTQFDSFLEAIPAISDSGLLDFIFSRKT